MIPFWSCGGCHDIVMDVSFILSAFSPIGGEGGTGVRKHYTHEEEIDIIIVDNKPLKGVSQSRKVY